MKVARTVLNGERGGNPSDLHNKEKEIVLSKNFDRINNEIEYMLNQLLGLKINGKRDPRKKEVDE